MKDNIIKDKNNIPSKEAILSLVKKKPRANKQLYDLLDIKPDQKQPFLSRINAMLRDEELICSKKGFYRIPTFKGSFKKSFEKKSKPKKNSYEKNSTRKAQNPFLVGTVISNPKGFGFVALEKGGRDLKLSSAQMKKVFHGDKIRVRLVSNRGDAEIIHILKSKKTIVGRLHMEDQKTHLVIDDNRIKHNVIIPKTLKDSEHDQVVNVEIIQHPFNNDEVTGKIVDVLGAYMDEGVETDAALFRHNIPVKFSDKTLEETKKFSNTLKAKDKQQRVDLTKLKLITIDGDDSKDFDDAVYAEDCPQGWKLYVAIADVSHYVKEDSSLDREARDRGNSVYFPRRVVPMLPEKLSNGLCSLNPGAERLCLTCEMTITRKGQLENYKFYPALMQSHARLTYKKVNMILEGEGGPDLIKKYADVIDNIKSLHDLYKNLKIARRKRGVMDFDRIESKILFDDQGKISNIIADSRNDAHKLIEECMILANQATALFLGENKEDFLYRTHPKPTPEKITLTRTFLESLGLTLKGGDTPKPQDFSWILKKAKGREDENIIKTIVLRTMKQAVYTPKNTGHFGLALENYTHFTSPIRRYSDLLAHRAIKRVLEKKKKKPTKKMFEAGQHLSITERRADEASREVEKWLKCEYMRSRIGETFEGIVSGVSAHGLYIELKDVFVEGMAQVADMKDDKYVFDKVHYQLKGQRNKKVYRFGETLTVLLASVNLDERQMIFTLINETIES